MTARGFLGTGTSLSNSRGKISRPSPRGQMQGPPRARPAPALAAEPGYGPGLAPNDRPGHYTGPAASDMNRLYAATIGPDGQQASGWQDRARTRVSLAGSGSGQT